MEFRLSRYHVVSDPLPTGDDGETARFIYATRAGKVLKISEHIFSLLQSGKIDMLPTEIAASLFAVELIVPQEEDEFSVILSRNKLAVDNADVLDITIQPTANCQLGCVYCGQQHAKVTATDELGDKVLDRITANLDKGKYRALSVQWFGAEPLMAYSKILSMSDRLIEMCNARGVTYFSQMITNGLSFKPLIFKSLAARGCRHFQITLDGTSTTHDNLRMTKGGAKTFDTILDNVCGVVATDEFVQTKSSIVIRINVNRESAEEVPSLIDLLAARGLQEREVQIDFEPVVNWGDNEASLGSLTYARYAEREIDWTLHAIEKGFKFGQFLPKRRTTPCMVVQPDGEVYDAYGNIYPCYEFPYTPVFSGPEYKIGHLDTIDEIKNDEAITRKWFRDVEGDVAPCKKCNLFPVCGGGCPKKWLHGERACPSYKDNISDRLALHVLSKSGRLHQVAH